MNKFFTDKDQDELTRLFDYCNGLVFLDKEYADSLETIESQRNASPYVLAYFGINDYDPVSNKQIIEHYVELNPYYQALYVEYGIVPAISRNSQHLAILTSTNKSLNKDEELTFNECYYEALNYYNKVLSTKAFMNHQNRPNFIKLFLTWCTIQRYLNRKLDDLFNVDVYSARTLKNAFISAGVDYFDKLPINYQRRLLKKLNTIISNKGTEQCFVDILNTFGLDTTCIYKYYLVKKYTNEKNIEGKVIKRPSLVFYKVPLNEKINIKKHEQCPFSSIVSADIYWQATEEEILEKEFNIVPTKYISIDNAIDINKDVLKMSYFMNMLENLFVKNNDNGVYFFNTKISKSKINLYDGFVALISLALRLNGYKDRVVVNPDVANYIYGYSTKDNAVEVNRLIQNIKNELEKDDSININKKLYLINFLDNNFKIDVNYDKQYSLTEFIDIFEKNENIRETLNEIIIEMNNHKIYKDLNSIYDLKMRTNLNRNLFRGFETYFQYVSSKDLDLAKFITINENDYDTEEDIFIAYTEKIMELCTSLSNAIYDDNVSDAIIHTPMYGITSYLQYFISTLILLFKSYTVELKDSKLQYYIKDKKNENIRLRDYLIKYHNKIIRDYGGLIDSAQIIHNGNIIN